MSYPCNIADALREAAQRQPTAIAIRCPLTRRSDGQVLYDDGLSYAELDRRSDAIARGLIDYGLPPGSRCALMVRPAPELFLCMFALFRAGIVPVLIDPGIAKRALKQCLAEAAPQGFIGIPLAQLARVVLGWARGSVKKVITVGTKITLGGTVLAEIEARGRSSQTELPTTLADDLAAILFTSGSTGVPKGVSYRQRHFVAQIELLRRAFGIEPGGVNLPTFPPFALFDPALGYTSIIPDMDPTRPAKADPRRLLSAMRQFGVTQMFGSPALLDVLSRHGQAHKIRLPQLRRVLSAGAPVPPEVVARMQPMLADDGEIWTPYGATECLPVAVIEGRELRDTRIATEAGAGTCVGRPVPPNEVRLIAIDDQPITDWQSVRAVERGEVGEITVAGPSVTDEYYRRPEATALAKIRERLADGSERIVHRMGDLGWFDDHGRLWFCGRKTQRVESADGPLYTEQVEPVFNLHPAVRRTALVGLGARGQQRAVLCVELEAKSGPIELTELVAELRQLGDRHAHTRKVQDFLLHPGFPVDIRHNAKIGRETLSRWAANKLGLA